MASTSPLAHYPTFLEAKRNRRAYSGNPNKLFPMRISARITEINKDGIIGFRWIEDDRNFAKFETALNKEYAENQRLGTIRAVKEVEEETTYITFLDMGIKFCGYYRCQILLSNSINGPNKLILIDHGVIFDVKSGEVDLFYHHKRDDEYNRFAYAGFCCLADSNQCEQIGAPTIDKLSADEEVELFLLSSQEPYYAVASSLRNSETKLVEAALIQDLTPEFAETWNMITMNHFEAEAALRPTMALCPRWIHGYNPVSVTVPRIESLEKVAVADLLCSLRSCILSEYLFNHYSKPEVQEALKVTDPVAELGVGTIVVAYDVKPPRFYRAQITELNLVSNSASLVGLDFPNWVSCEHSFDDLWLLSKTIQLFPRQFHNVAIKRNLDRSTRDKLALAELARCYCPPHSVALMQYKENTLDVELITGVFPLLALIGIRNDELYHERIMSSDSPRPTIWKKERNGFSESKKDGKVTNAKKVGKENEAEKVAEEEKSV